MDNGKVMKVVSTPVKRISVSGDYLIVELSPGIMIVEKPRYIGFFSSQSIIDSSNLMVFIGSVFFLLVLGVFADLANIVSPSIWHAFTILVSGLLLLGLVIARRKNVLIIVTANETYYFTRPYGVDERLLREIVMKVHPSSEQIQPASSTTKPNYSSMVEIT